MTTTDESEDLLAHLFVGGNIHGWRVISHTTGPPADPTADALQTLSQPMEKAATNTWQARASGDSYARSIIG